MWLECLALCPFETSKAPWSYKSNRSRPSVALVPSRPEVDIEQNRIGLAAMPETSISTDWPVSAANSVALLGRAGAEYRLHMGRWCYLLAASLSARRADWRRPVSSMAPFNLSGSPALVRPVQSSNQPFAVPACVRNHPLLGPWPEASLGSGRHGWCPSPSTAQAELNSTELDQPEVWHRHGDRSKNIAADASRLSANRLLKGGWLFHWQKTSLSLQ